MDTDIRDRSNCMEVHDAAMFVREFSASFETDFARVSLEEQKVILKKWVEDITIDRDASKSRFKVRRNRLLSLK